MVSVGKLDPITVPDIVLEQLNLWEQDPFSILTSEATLSLRPSQDFPSRLYLALVHTRTSIDLRSFSICLCPGASVPNFWISANQGLGSCCYEPARFGSVRSL